jgi:lipopolysaccharide export system protein LptC
MGSDARRLPRLTPRQRNALLLLAAIAVFVTLINLPATEAPRPALPPELIGEPDLYMRDATILQHDENGELRYRMHAREARHFDARAVTIVDWPRVTLFRPGEPPWHLRAERGDVRTLMHADGTQEEVVDLRDDVEILQQGDDARFFVLATDAMQLYPNRRYAESDRPVIIESNAGTTTGVGFRAALDVGTFEVGADSVERVHTVVYPQHAREGR